MSDLPCSARELTGSLTVRPGCVLDYHLRLPLLPDHPLLSEYYLQAARQYERQIVQHYMPVLRRLPADALQGPLTIEASFEQMFCRGGIVSFFTDTYEDLGLYRRTLYRRSEIWAAASGRMLSLQDLFRDPAAVRRLISAHIVQKRAESPPGIYYAADPPHVRRSFYLTDGGMAVYYPVETIAPFSGGIPTFLVPWESLRPYAKFPL